LRDDKKIIEDLCKLSINTPAKHITSIGVLKSVSEK